MSLDGQRGMSIFDGESIAKSFQIGLSEIFMTFIVAGMDGVLVS